MLYKEDWDKVRKRFEALWEREIIDRCCISVMAPKKSGFQVPSTSKTYDSPDDLEERRKYWSDPDTILKKYITRFENTYHGGEALPEIFLNLGAAGNANYFGSKAVYGKTSIWFDPIMETIDSEKVKFEPNSELYVKGKEIAKYLCKEGKNKFFVSMPDNAVGIDVLSHLIGADNLLMELYDKPDEIKKAVKIIKDNWVHVSSEFYDIIRDCNYGGSCVGWLNTWAPNTHAQIQCDMSVMISKPMFDEFVMDELRCGSEELKYPLYHLDGQEQIRHLDSLLSIEKLKMIQWTSVEGQPPATDFIPTLKKIQEAGKCLLLNVRPRYVEKLMTELSSKGLYIVTDCETVDEADSLVKLVEKLTHE